MSGSVNSVTLIGHLGRDPEVRTFQNGGRVCNLSLATSESWKKDGERKSKTEWHRLVLFDERLVDVAEKYLRKGSLVYLRGQLETRKFTDNSGAERYTTEVVLRPFRSEIVMLGDKQERQGPPTADDHLSEPPFDARTGGTADLDDEIAFAKCIH